MRLEVAAMTKYLLYILEAEDTCSGYQPGGEGCGSYGVTRGMLRWLKTLFWVCAAVIIGLAIGNL